MKNYDFPTDQTFDIPVYSEVFETLLLEQLHEFDVPFTKTAVEKNMDGFYCYYSVTTKTVGTFMSIFVELGRAEIQMQYNVANNVRSALEPWLYTELEAISILKETYPQLEKLTTAVNNAGLFVFQCVLKNDVVLDSEYFRFVGVKLFSNNITLEITTKKLSELEENLKKIRS